MATVTAADAVNANHSGAICFVEGHPLETENGRRESRGNSLISGDALSGDVAGREFVSGWEVLADSAADSV
jgi:hypothetical protein